MSYIALLLPKAPVPYNDLPKSPIPDLLKKPILFQYSPTTTTSDQGSPTTTQGLTKSTASSHGVSILSPPANDSLRQEMSGKFKSLSRPVATMESPKGSMKIERPNPAIVEIKLKCCRKEFTTYKNMMEHLEVSHSAKSELNFFTCWVCRATFQKQSFLSVHMWSSHHEKMFKCHICFKTFAKQHNLCQHISVVHDGENSRVDNALKPVLIKYENGPAMLIDEMGSQYECQICHNFFQEKKSLSTHMWVEHHVKAFTCTLCSKSFHHQRNLGQHNRLVHRRMKQMRGRRPLPCSPQHKVHQDVPVEMIDSSTQSIVDQIEKLQKEMSINLGKSDVKIQEDKLISKFKPIRPKTQPLALIQGQVPIVSDAKTTAKPKFSPPIVEAVKPYFAVKSEPPLRISEDEPFSSKMTFSGLKIPSSSFNLGDSKFKPEPTGVNLSLTKPSDLFSKILGPLQLAGKEAPAARKTYLHNRVNRIASALSNSSCQICGEGHKILGKLLKHMWEAHEMKTFVCEICKKSFGHRKVLVEHINHVHCSERKHACKVCGRTFAKNYLLQNHLKTVHGCVSDAKFKMEPFSNIVFS